MFEIYRKHADSELILKQESLTFVAGVLVERRNDVHKNDTNQNDIQYKNILTIIGDDRK